MTVGSDNPFPSVLFAEHVDPANPSAGTQRLFVDTDHILKLINSAGTVSNIVTGTAGLADPMTTRGDIIYRNASNVSDRLGRGSAGKVLTSDGTDIAWQTPSAAGMATDTLWDAAGDLAVGTGANTGAKLVVGTTNYGLKVVAGTPAWGLPHSWGCIISGTSTALSSGAFTSLSFGVADTYDPDAYHDPSGSPTLMTVPTGLGGQYCLKVQTSWPSSASANTDRRIAYRVNGGTDITITRETYSVTSLSIQAQMSVDLVLAAGDTVAVRQWTGIGSTTTVAYFASLFLIGV